MSKIFKSPKPAPLPPPPPIPEPIPVPTVDEAKDSSDASDRVRRRKGQASTILAGGKEGALATAPVTAGAKLLGQ